MGSSPITSISLINEITMKLLWAILKWVFNSIFAKKKVYGKATRSSKWPAFRQQILDTFKKCAVCGRNKELEVHHIIPFHQRPDLELDSNNCIVLCADPCHFVFGHLYNWTRCNKDVVKDSIEWKKKIENAG